MLVALLVLVAVVLEVTFEDLVEGGALRPPGPVEARRLADDPRARAKPETRGRRSLAFRPVLGKSRIDPCFNPECR